MILLPYSRPWTQQPQEGAAVNWGHPLARGLAAASIAGGTPGDITPYTNANGYSLEAGAQGLYGRLTSASTQYWYSTDAARIVTTHPLTALAIVRPATVHAGAVLTVYNSTSQYHELMVGSTGQLQLWSTAVGTSSASAASAYVAGEEFVVAGRVSSDTSRDVWKNGIRLASNTTSRAPTAATANRWGLFNGTTERFNGGMALRLLWGRALSDAEMGSIGVDPWQLFEPQRIWVPVSAAGGGAITIDGNLGNATAAGTAGQVGVAITVDASTGNATAAGTTAQVGVSIDITGSVGNAAAAGVTGLPGVSLDIAATTGNAVAAGITGVVDLGGSITIDGNVGAAVAAGVQGLPGVAVTIDGAAGGAVAAGVSGSVSVTNDITINATAGNAVAAGILAGLSLDIEVAGVIGNATAAGTTGTVSLSGSGTGATAAEIWSYTLSNGLTAEATVVAIHTMLSELHLIHGLTVGSPLSVTVASRAAGAVSQAVAEAAGTVTVTRQ